MARLVVKEWTPNRHVLRLRLDMCSKKRTLLYVQWPTHLESLHDHLKDIEKKSLHYDLLQFLHVNKFGFDT